MIYLGLIAGVVIALLFARLMIVEWKLYVARVEARKACGLFNQLFPRARNLFLDSAGSNGTRDVGRLLGCLNELCDVLDVTREQRT